MALLHENITGQIIGLAIEVHKNLGPGLLESAYRKCLLYELLNAGLQTVSELPCPVKYKNIEIECGYRIDLVVNDCVILELKCVEKLQPVHEAQLLTYMKLYDKKIGLLINFNEKLLNNGIKRLIL